ncbi:hypothetical protein [Labedaea rhizosphaerae]|uniref:Uncharacterized protein n=1 Tax=Labedaea rhizosphaerae TaxID=598644 RepID=A0A4R6RXN3_LABRH|nr:hypothetical protein [Labedaea rhizosphaerae]TDP91839.1 hypothetical protein EV186_10848 [Labedaea rhizosphaerae]
MNEILTQARAQFSAIAQECTTGLAEAQARLDRARAEAKRNSEEVAKATARTAATFTKELKKNGEAYPAETFSFGPDPDADEATARAPQQAPAPSAASVPPGGRRPSAAEDRAEDEQGPRIFNEDSW